MSDWMNVLWMSDWIDVHLMSDWMNVQWMCDWMNMQWMNSFVYSFIIFWFTSAIDKWDGFIFTQGEELGGFFLLQQSCGGCPLTIFQFPCCARFPAQSCLKVWSTICDPGIHRPACDFVFRQLLKWCAGSAITTVLCRPNGQVGDTIFILCKVTNITLLHCLRPYETATSWVFDPPPLRGVDRNLVLSPGRRSDQHYQELASRRASGHWKYTNCHITRFRLRFRNRPTLPMFFFNSSFTSQSRYQCPSPSPCPHADYTMCVCALPRQHLMII